MNLKTAAAAFLLTFVVAFSTMPMHEARTNEGGGAEGPGGNAAPAIRNVSLETFMELSKSRLIDLRELHAREDTDVVVGGFPATVVKDLLQAAIDDRSALRRLLRALRGVNEDTKRQDVINAALTRASAKQGLLESDVRNTRDQIDEETDKINQDRTSSTGVFRTPFVETPRLKVLRETEREQSGRLIAAQRFRSFIISWLGRPHWGR